jgi:hypothetical protein
MTLQYSLSWYGREENSMEHEDFPVDEWDAGNMIEGLKDIAKGQQANSTDGFPPPLGGGRISEEEKDLPDIRHK